MPNAAGLQLLRKSRCLQGHPHLVAGDHPRRRRVARRHLLHARRQAGLVHLRTAAPCMRQLSGQVLGLHKMPAHEVACRLVQQTQLL